MKKSRKSTEYQLNATFYDKNFNQKDITIINMSVPIKTVLKYMKKLRNLKREIKTTVIL